MAGAYAELGRPSPHRSTSSLSSAHPVRGQTEVRFVISVGLDGKTCQMSYWGVSVGL